MTGKTLGHYEVLEKIGAGGMGEVYRAHDRHLERDVALKILPAGFLADEISRKRFRREALALSKLNHPNIATVFDFDTEGGVDFLAMELVRGTPLSERLNAGPVPEREAVRLGCQLADGLAAAHAEGVIHRDLKPGNLMITPEGRLKILDFGLAIVVRSEDAPDVTRSRTETASVEGTLPYMTPEQLRGLSGDARSDIYAAGAVLYEMAAGQRPFPQSQSNELIGAILHQPPAPPRTHNDRTTASLERVVMKALEKEPTARYQSARELLVALEGLGIGAPPARYRPGGWRVVAAGGAIAAVLIGALAIALNLSGVGDRVWRRGTGGKEPARASNIAVRTRRSVAVLGFKNLSGRQDAAWLSTALSEMLTTELAAGEQLRTIPGENVAQMKINLSLADAESYGRDTLARIRQNLSTDDVVLGSYLTLAGGQVRLDLRLQDAVAGETLAAVSERGSVAQLDDLVSRAGLVLREKLGAGRVAAADALSVKASVPSNADAVRLYAEGLAKLRVFDNLTARDLLEKAVAADPDHALAHSALATAWTSLGYDERAKTEAKRAFELSGKLSREDQLAVEGKYRDVMREREKTIEIYRTLWGFFPDNLDHGLQLADAQTYAGKGRDALATVEALRKLPAPAPTDPRVDLAEASAAAAVSEFKRQRTAAVKSVASASNQGARLLAARAQLAQGAALRALGDLSNAVLAYDSARAIFAAAGDRGRAADASRSIGFVLWQRGDLSRAEEELKEALGIQREIGDKRGLSASLITLGNVRAMQGDLPAAKKLFEDSLGIRRELDDRSGVANSLNNVGNVLFFQGNKPEAKKVYEEVLAIRREIGEKAGVAVSLNNLGEVLRGQSDLAGARRMLEEALAIRQEIGDRSGVASTLVNLGALLAEQGDLSGAREQIERALAIQNEIGEKGQAADSRRALATVLLDEGQAARAETLSRQAAEEFQTEKADVSEAFARGVLAESQLAQSKLGDAQKTIDVSVRLLKKTDDREKRVSVLITAARIRAASGKPAEAVQSLEAILVEAARFHLGEAEFEARLALGEVEMTSGKTTAGRARLAALERDATSKGFLLVARKARAAASRTP